jgi:preprotein translocase subunit SecY
MASTAEKMAANINFAKFAQATELKKRLWFTIGALVVFRFLSHVPLPGVDPTVLKTLYAQTQGGVLDIFNTFSGGALERMSLIALGVMPYITASIVVQLAASLSPQLAAIKKEGESGRKKLNQYTRYGTVLLTAVQGYFIAVGLEACCAQGLQAVVEPGVMFRVTAVISPGRRHDVPDVARRADHLARDRQRYLADHHGGHRRPVAGDAGQPVRVAAATGSISGL